MQTTTSAAQASSQDARTSPAAYRAAHSARNAKKIGPIILVLCLAMAVLAVLLIPVLVNGNADTMARTTRIAVEHQDVAEFRTVREAVEKVGFVPSLPANVPDAAKLVAARTLDGTTLELEYTVDGNSLLVRMAQGAGDLSGGTSAEFAYTVTEEIDGITRSYMGASEKQLNLAMWAHDGNSYALVAAGGVDAVLVKQLAESID